MKSGVETYSSAIEQAHNYTRWVLDAFSGYIGRWLLEVGLGHGGYRPFLADVERYIGIDIDAEAIARAAGRYPRDVFLCSDVTDPGLIERLRIYEIDTVLCVNVLEHIEQDAKAVEVLLEVLRPGGHLLLFMPAMPAIYGTLDRLAGHYRRYTKGSIEALVPQSLGRVVVSHYFNAIGVIGWWLNGRVGYASLDAQAVNRQIMAFDRYVVPLARIIDPLFTWTCGQSLVTVVEKNAKRSCPYV